MSTAEYGPADVQCSQDLFAHAWMVRTFVKHSAEVEEFPELMQAARTIFDVSRSLESRVDDPTAYFRQLRKKFHRLKAAAEQFRQDAPLASDHTNFRQAVQSFEGCVRGWDRLLCTHAASPSKPTATPQNEAAEPVAELDATAAFPDDDDA